MEIIKSGQTIGLYNSIKEIPAGRLMGFQLQLAQHNSMGSTFEELDASGERLYSFLAAGRCQDARLEYENRRQGFWLMFHNINTQLVVLANLVKSINGVAVSVRTDDEALRVAKILGDTDISTQEVEDIIESVKKKLTAELRRYLPQMFKDNSEIAVAADVVQQALLRIEHAKGKGDKSEELSDIENRILDTIKPLCFDSDDSNNYQVEAERSFEALCVILAGKGVHKAHEISALQFYLNIQLLSNKKPQGNEEWQPEI